MDTISNKLTLFQNNFMVNWHEHVWMKQVGNRRELNKEGLTSLIRAAEDNYMDYLVCSLPITSGPAKPERCREANDFINEAVMAYPKKMRAMCYVDPGFGQEAVLEIERCVKKLGMIGVKLYNQYTMDDPVQRLVIEKCIELDVPILIHAGYSRVCFVDQPNMSHSEQIARAAKAYPECQIIMAHVTGGGDWMWQLRGIADCPNVVTDISGSIIDIGSVEETVRYLGAERVLFGTDGSVTLGVGKLLGTQISEKDKITILAGEKYRRFLKEDR
jgi:Predicted metal-dependent hydrolase of the TIM-barrel fold